ncbi:MAG: aldo/keto reductase [Verrucomicrobiota bacterium]|nr:aldo/keto reductase [Verrucomicrobiota bacterium]
MERRKLGKTELELPVISYGASSLGQEFRRISIDEALRSCRSAIDLGMDFIDTSPFYGRGMSEVMLGQVLRDIPRDSFTLGTKLGRYDLHHFDFSAKRVAESIDVSLHRMGVDYIDIILCHDIEFVKMQQIVDETIPAIQKIRDQGKVRYIGFSGYPMKIFPFIIDQIDIDVVLSYNNYHLQNTRFSKLFSYLNERNIGIMNAGPFCARLLTNTSLPNWHKEPEGVRNACKKASEFCSNHGVDIAQLAVQYCVANTDITTTIAGSANPDNVQNWGKWAEIPIDQELLQGVLSILDPVKDIGHIEGLTENN